MKTKEFIKRVKELGYDVKLRNDYIQIIHDEFVAVVVYVNVMYSITFHQIIKTSWNNGDKLFDLIVEYVRTPVDEREEEKKFYLKHKYFKCTNGDSRYFQIYESNGAPWLNAMDSIMGYKKQFTKKEIEGIKEKFDTDLADFELVEVVDD